ncbi:MAG: hypothetical protein AAB877_02445 [Patescibacteria group bacterium]
MSNYIHKFINKKFAKNYIIIAAVALVLFSVTYFIAQKPKAPPERFQQPSQSQTSQKTPSEQTGNTQKTPTVAQTISYNEALIAYANKRIQFDENCAVSPGSPSFKTGTKIMLDNRASKARQVYFDEKAYNLQAYGFKIITLSTAFPLPHTIKIDCGNGKNNGSIILQR